MFWFFFSNPFTHVNIVNLKIKTKSHYFAHQIRITKPILLQNLNLKPILLQNLSSSHTLTSPSAKPKTNPFLPPKSKPKTQILPLLPPPPRSTTTASFGFPVLYNSFSTCYYFQLKIKLHTQCPGTLAFLFLFSLNLSFSIETKQRKGSLLNDENRGNISFLFLIWKYDLGFGIVVWLVLI